MSTDVHPTDDAKSLSGETLCDIEYPHSFPNAYSNTSCLWRTKSTWSEIIFVVSVLVSRSLFGYSLIGFPTLLPTLVDTFNLEGTSSTWLVSAVPLVLSTFFIPFRRLAERVGMLLVFQCGLAWNLVWTLLAGTSTSYTMLIACRAMQGLGGAAHFLSGATLLNSLYAPGPRRERAFFMYESMEVLGSFIGILVAGLSSQYLSWQWYFWVSALLALQALIGVSLTASESVKACGKMSNVRMDWLGCITTTSALISTMCWIIELPNSLQGWWTPYHVAIAVLSIVSLGFAIYVEGWVAKDPLLPPRILETRGVGPLLVGLFFGCGATGLYVLYAILYIRNIMEVEPLRLVLWLAPMTITGSLLPVFKCLLLRTASGTVMLILTACIAVIAPLLLALAPLGASYWAYFFPVMLCAPITLDLVFHVTSALLATTLPASDRKLTGTLANALAQSSIALIYGAAAMVEAFTEHQGKVQGYKNVFWLATACGSTALFIFVLLARIEKPSCCSLIKWIS